MSDSFLLSKIELIELTGSKHKALQAKWLKKNRWVFATDINERPTVARKYALMRFGVSEEATRSAPAAEPNFDALCQ
ncbi:DUF4224 domain-containing protein [Chitinimonas sp. BJB300]|uniref:DUF4224 domain-containing protein n=1 Tax=Chitinimonas sp. BJB300 TaxID=1559339 RepID=UPI0011126FB0|nr:DUF4224 domain-containing protein [Chitinimonas sp. BJB300]TSJ88182.1 DUF4224 domain-containing protein [Chitinimonas sp. BJB300]